MNILDFIETEYPIREQVKDRLSDPYKRIEESDSFPYDCIARDEDGRLVKMVELEDETLVPVIEIMATTEEDAKVDPRCGFYDVWTAYMSNIVIEDVNVTDILESVKLYKKYQAKRENNLDVLS